jgi:hypothetical protein
MKVASATTPRWVVSTRTRGEVLVAGVSIPSIEIALLGVPAEVTPREAEDWLRDLAGVAEETARADDRERALPALLFHALSGLLFTQAELWGSHGAHPPCAIAFVETPRGAAFGWVGDARVRVNVDGRAIEPAWTIVRDEQKRESHGALLAGAHVQVVIEYGAGRAAGAEAPAQVDAEWSVEGREAKSLTAPGPLAREREAPAEAAAATDAHASANDAAPEATARDDDDGVPGEISPEQALALESLTAPRMPHPVARWLGRILSFTRPRPAAPRVHVVRTEDSAPISAYDALLSNDVPPTSEEPLAPAPIADAPIESTSIAPLAPSAAPMAARAVAPPPADEATPPAPAIEFAREKLVRAMNTANAAELPVLRVPAAGETRSEPLAVDHEPVGADATFAIPKVPLRPAAKPRAFMPEAKARPEPAPPAIAAPKQPRVLRVRPEDGTAKAPSLIVPAANPPADAPPVLHVDPAAAPPAALDLEPPDGMLLAYAPKGPPLGRPRRWPVPEPPKRRRIEVSRRTWVLIGVIVGVFAAGWIVGIVATPSGDEPGPMVKALRAVGLGGSHFDAVVGSNPPGAWIAIDGKDVARRTPSTIELSPGSHAITLSLPDLGSASVTVKGHSGERLSVAPSLDGSLVVQAPDADVPISVELDGKALGYAPLRVDPIAAGLHEVQFSGPGMPAWAQNVSVGIRREEVIVARPMSAPANGVIQVQATLNDETGSTPLAGAQVWVDGELHGVSPTSLDLPRGPHSLRLTWHGETAPIQVIDLPGGNRRFAAFNFGLEMASPRVALLGGVHPANLKQNAMVSAALEDLPLRDVREAWLHVRTPEGLWRRYPMTPMRGAHGPIVACVFPPAAFDGHGQSRWYVSVSTLQGDEAFTEMQSASVGAGSARRHDGEGAKAAASSSAADTSR